MSLHDPYPMPALEHLATALAKAQAQIKGAVRDSENPYFKSAYADLASVWDACRAPLTANGLSVVQLPGPVEIGDPGAFVELRTMLLHESGQFLASTLRMPVKDLTPQGVGSAITYARRYALAAVVGVAPEDDDGEAAMGRDKAPKPAKKPEPDPLETARRGVFSVLKQLVDAGKADPVLLDHATAGQFAREALRRKLMGDSPWDKNSLADMRAFLEFLQAHRDELLPVIGEAP